MIKETFSHEKHTYENEFIRQQFTRCEGVKDPDFFFKNVIIIGCGGIGANVASFLAEVKNIRILLFDDDTLELHNLNRTPFSYDHVGHYKVDAIKDMIESRNITADIYNICRRWKPETVEDIMKAPIMIEKSVEYPTIESCVHTRFFADDAKIAVFDCRDGDYKDHDLLPMYDTNREKYTIIRPAYNGSSLTLTANWMEYPVWGPSGYETIPSSSFPAKLVAMMAILFADVIGSGNMNADYMKEIYTFEKRDILNILFNEYDSYQQIIHSAESIDNNEEKRIVNTIDDETKALILKKNQEIAKLKTMNKTLTDSVLKSKEMHGRCRRLLSKIDDEVSIDWDEISDLHEVYNELASMTYRSRPIDNALSDEILIKDDDINKVSLESVSSLSRESNNNMDDEDDDDLIEDDEVEMEDIREEERAIASEVRSEREIPETVEMRNQEVSEVEPETNLYGTITRSDYVIG